MVRNQETFFGAGFDCRKITPTDIAKFRDSLDCSRVVLERHLQHIHGMFAAASKEWSSPFAGMANPAAGIRVLGKPVPKKDGTDKVFTPAQVRTILDTAAAIKFGRGRHADILLMLRVLAFTGLRPNECAQLQAGDLVEIDGIKAIKVQSLDAINGKPHAQKSVKTAESRIVPMHPEIADFFEHAKSFSKKDDFIFGAFKWNKDNGRAAWLSKFFPRLLHNDCGIIDQSKRQTLYSLRHSFVTAMRNAKVPEDVRMLIVGHAKGQHTRYGSTDLKILAEAIAATKPAG